MIRKVHLRPKGGVRLPWNLLLGTDHNHGMKLPPYSFLVPVALGLGLAPFVPEPHLVEKTRMLLAGELSRPIDIFDLFFHSAPLGLLLVKVVVDLRSRWKGRA